MAESVTHNFCKITHKHIEEILDLTRGSLDVAQLTHALQKTVLRGLCLNVIHGEAHPIHVLR